MAKRILLFVGTNIAVLLIFSIIMKIFNVGPMLTQHGLNYTSLLISSAIFGFLGSFISLFMSKMIAKMSMGVKIIDRAQASGDAAWLISIVEQLAQRVGIRTPEVGIYDSPEPNAFATGWNRNNALVAVSTGLLRAMNRDEIEGVLGHELSHVANGDMVTLALIQGILNTFVLFFARIAAYFVTQALSRGEDSQPGALNSMVFFLVEIVFQIVFGILASMIVMWFSRFREYRADAGSARLLGKQKMILALQKLQQMQGGVEDKRAPSFEAMKIAGHKRGFLALLASHPPLEDRIKALETSKN
ncbi:MAG: protease HtpX [Gammaproteobacteria bacterium]|nr:protease HtpX [Gammaproteobacteria bacterium]